MYVGTADAERLVRKVVEVGGELPAWNILDCEWQRIRICLSLDNVNVAHILPVAVQLSDDSP